MADPFDVCDRCEAAIVSLLDAETLLDGLQIEASESAEAAEADRAAVSCEGATEYQRNSGIWVVAAKVRLSVHGLDDGGRGRLLTYWQVIHQALRRTDLAAALSGADLRVAGARAWAVARSKEDNSWVREMSCELLAHLRV